jgi:hypothetical protein
MPNREQALIEAGLIKDTRPGYNSPPEYLTNSNKTTAPQASTSTEAKAPNVTTQQTTTLQAPTTKSISETQVPTAKTISVTALTDSIFRNPYIAMQTFISGQTTTTPQASTKIEETNDQATDQDDDILPNALLKKKHQTDSVLKQHIKNNTSSGSLTPPPPDNDPDDDWFEKLKKNYEKKAFHNKYKNFYKDAETELWWSLDRAEHGGYHCKVYKETATGLEWIYNAETSGTRIYGQHKSPGSRFIPYSELVFY